MSDIANRLYGLIIDKNINVSPELKKKMLIDLIRDNNLEILGAYFSTEMLTNDLEKYLLENGSPEQLALWARVGKTNTARAVALVEGLLSSKALTTLAFTEGLGSDVYSAIYRKSQDRSTLLGLVQNGSVPAQISIDSLDSMRRLFPKEYHALTYSDLNFDNSFETEICKKERELKNILMVKPEHTITLLKFVEYMKIERDDFTPILSNITSFLESDSCLEVLSNDAIDLEPIIEEITSGLQLIASRNSDLTSDVLYLLTSLTTIVSNKSLAGGCAKKLDEARKFLTNSDLVELGQILEKCESSEELEELVSKILSYYRSGRLSSEGKVNLLLEALQSRHATPNQQSTILSQMEYLFSEKVAKIQDPDLLGRVLALTYSPQPLEIIEQSLHPAQCFNSYFNTLVANDLHIDDSIYGSKYLEIEHLLSIKLETLAYSAMAEHAEKSIITHIVSQLNSVEQWEYLSTLGDSFQGSVGDIVKVCKKL